MKFSDIPIEESTPKGIRFDDIPVEGEEQKSVLSQIGDFIQYAPGKAWQSIQKVGRLASGDTGMPTWDDVLNLVDSGAFTLEQAEKDYGFLKPKDKPLIPLVEPIERNFPTTETEPIAKSVFKEGVKGVGRVAEGLETKEGLLGLGTAMAFPGAAAGFIPDMAIGGYEKAVGALRSVLGGEYPKAAGEAGEALALGIGVKGASKLEAPENFKAKKDYVQPLEKPVEEPFRGQVPLEQPVQSRPMPNLQEIIQAAERRKTPAAVEPEPVLYSPAGEPLVKKDVGRFEVAKEGKGIISPERPIKFDEIPIEETTKVSTKVPEEVVMKTEYDLAQKAGLGDDAMMKFVEDTQRDGVVYRKIANEVIKGEKTPEQGATDLKTAVEGTLPEVQPKIPPLETRAETQPLVDVKGKTYEPLKPVASEGPIVPSRAGAKLAEAAGLEAPTHRQASIKQHGDLVKTDIERAKRIAYAQEAPPEGVLASSVMKDLEVHATKNMDAKTIYELAQSPIHKEHTRMGQELSALQEVDPHSPLSIVRAIEQHTEKTSARRKGSADKVKEQIKRDIDVERAKLEPKQFEFTSFLESIKCK